MEIQTLARAPIVEAVLDIRLGDPAPIATIDTLRDELSADFSDVRSLQQFQLDLRRQGAEMESTQRHRPNGLLFRDEDEQWLLQGRTDGFTLSRINGYSTWDDLSAAAHKYWRVYSEKVEPATISRTAVRYVNRIELPLPVMDLSKYFHVALKLPEALPQSFSELLIRGVMQFESYASSAIVTMLFQRVEPSAEVAEVILDIDVYNDTPCEAAGDSLWSRMEQHRAVKNLVFFETLSDALLETYR